MDSDLLIHAARPDEALQALTERVRANPADAKLRVFLFQLLCVLGQWERAMTQLNVAAELDAANLLMAQVCRTALQCEALRAEVFSGTRSPMIFGEPPEWIGWLIQSNQLLATGEPAKSQELRNRAFEAAAAVAGTINGEPFEWIADADMRLGPVLEAIVDGRYFWVPFERIRKIDIAAPSDLRDLVWVPATFEWSNGGTAVGLIPTRYPGSQSSTDNAIRMARRTDWIEQPGGATTGLGQRIFATDAGEYPILETRCITLGLQAAPVAE